MNVGRRFLGDLFRYPSVLAKMSATLDVLSNGRLELGLGAGYWKPEFERYGIPLPGFDARMERSEGGASEGDGQMIFVLAAGFA